MVNSNRTIISNYNKDVNTNTIISEPITQTDYINPLSPIITLWQIPEKFSRVQVKNEDGANTYKVEVFNLSDVINSTYFYVDYTAQNVYFHISEVGKKVTLSYMGYGSQKISSSLIFTKKLNTKAYPKKYLHACKNCFIKIHLFYSPFRSSRAQTLSTLSIARR